MLKLSPQNLEAEESILGSLMIDKESMVRIADILKPEDFYSPQNARVYSCIMKLYEKHKPIDILSVTSELKDQNFLKDIGGSTYLTKLVESVPTSAHVEHYAKLVRDKKILRDLIHASAEISEHAFGPIEDMGQILDEIEKRIFSISQQSIVQKFIPVRDELNTAYERIERLHAHGGELRGTRTGFVQLDNILSGLQKSDMVIIGARPSLGKTSLVLDMARHISIKEKKSVGVFSLEMSREQVIDRLISAESRVPLWRLRTGKIQDENDFTLIQHALGVLSEASLYIDDTPSPNILQMRSMARRLQMEHGLDVLIIDYLQLVLPRTGSDNMVTQITEISRGLKGLARELNVPVIVLSQLSRAVESRDRHVPRLSDLRDSGCLAGDTKIVRADTGETVTLRELAQRENQEKIPVFTLDERWKTVVRPLTRAWSSGLKQTFTLRTRSGRVIRGSGNHPFRKLESWLRLDALHPGDRIALPRSIRPSESTNPLSDDELILHAHLLGDGCTLPRQPIHYTNGDWDNIQIVKEVAKKLFNIQGRIVPQKNWWHIYLPSPYRLARGIRNPISNWLHSLGCGLKRSYEKVITQKIFQCDEQKIALFLRHLWATDGNISWKKLPERSLSAHIYYSSTSEPMIEQVQHLLLRLGILSTKRSVKQGKHHTSHQIWIQDSQNQIIFLETVGCFGARGKIIPKMLTALRKISYNPNTDVIPKQAWRLMIEPAKILAGFGWREFSHQLSVAYNGTAIRQNGIGRERMDRIASLFPENAMNTLAHSDVFWDEVISVTPEGVEEVYDATIEGTHNFVANDIFVHNSIEQDADVVMFIYRKDRDQSGTVAPEDENVAELIVAKHRNGPLGTVRIRFNPDYASFENMDQQRSAEPF